jgi:hypothetical protein
MTGAMLVGGCSSQKADTPDNLEAVTAAADRAEAAATRAETAARAASSVQPSEGDVYPADDVTQGDSDNSDALNNAAG